MSVRKYSTSCVLMLLAFAPGCSSLSTMQASSRAQSGLIASVGAAGLPLLRAAEPETVKLAQQIERAEESKSSADQEPIPTATRGSDFSLAQDRACFLSDLADDTHGLFTWRNGVILLAGAGASFGIHDKLDDEVARDTAGHERRWGDIDGFIKGAGNPITHLSAAAGLYAYSLLEDDAELHDLSKTLIDVIAIDAAASGILKFATNTQRPNGDRWGFPSGHVSSSVAVAAVLDETYGHRVGIPAYVFAGLVAWERIDDRQHDLSDVVFGALLGYVIGQTIGADHQAKFCGLECMPYVDAATGATGVALQKEF